MIAYLETRFNITVSETLRRAMAESRPLERPS
ncbi:hypothetical protein BH23CHL7_BH23CHL7_20880 [soil metagenome]